MKELGGLVSAAAFFTGGLIVEIEHAKHEGLKRAAKVIQKEAKEEIGTYQSAAGPFAAWAPLAPATLAGKASDTPLLETGALRDSIEYTVKGAEAEIGSNLEYAVFQELGTSKIPPRSFLGGAAVRKENEVVELLGKHVHGAIAGQKVIG